MTFRVACIAKNIFGDRRINRLLSPGLALAVVLLPGFAAAQSPAPAARAPAAPGDDLPALISAASAARESRDPAKVASANARVLALALRKLANVRLAQAAFSQALEL